MLLKSPLSVKLMNALREEFRREGVEWLSYAKVISLLTPLIPPQEALRYAEQKRVVAHRNNDKKLGRFNGDDEDYVVQKRVVNTEPTEQILIGQGTIVRARLLNFAGGGFIQIIKKDGRYSMLRMTEKGMNFDVIKVKTPTQKVIEPPKEAPIASYRVDMRLHVTDDMQEMGVAGLVGELNLEALQDVLDRAFPGAVTVTMLEAPEKSATGFSIGGRFSESR